MKGNYRLRKVAEEINNRNTWGKEGKLRKNVGK